jgi:hypothetical protein
MNGIAEWAPCKKDGGTGACHPFCEVRYINKSCPCLRDRAVQKYRVAQVHAGLNFICAPAATYEKNESGGLHI